MSDDLTPDPEQQRTEDAVAKRYSYKGRQLEPFSFLRQMMAQRLGLSFTSPMESEALLVFLCLQPAGDLLEARGDGQVGELRLLEKFVQWADSEGVAIVGESRKRVSEIANAIWEDISASSSNPQISGKSAPSDPKASRRATRRST